MRKEKLQKGGEEKKHTTTISMMGEERGNCSSLIIGVDHRKWRGLKLLDIWIIIRGFLYHTCFLFRK